MSTSSNNPSELSLDSRGSAPPVLSEVRPLYWSVRRELWESRSIYLAPLAVAAVYLVGFLLSTVRLSEKMRAAAADPAQQYKLITQPYELAAIMIMVATFIVALFYCLDALHSERRDRSILFWKSLPVSDRTTVLSKAIIPIVVLPVLTFTITVVTQGIMLLFSTVVLLGSGSGRSVTALWTELPLFRMAMMLFYHLLVVHGFFFAPIFCWLLLVSAFARRAVFLWAALPPLALFFIDKMIFGTSHFAAMLGSRLSGGAAAAVFPEPAGASHPMTHVGWFSFLVSPTMLIGLAVCAAFLATAVRLRRNREPI